MVLYLFEKVIMLRKEKKPETSGWLRLQIHCPPYALWGVHESPSLQSPEVKIPEAPHPLFKHCTVFSPLAMRLSSSSNRFQ